MARFRSRSRVGRRSFAGRRRGAVGRRRGGSFSRRRRVRGLRIGYRM